MHTTRPSHTLSLPQRRKGVFFPAFLVVCMVLLLLVSTRVYAAPGRPERVCPNGQTFILSGSGPALTAFLVSWNGQNVGGGTSDAAGSWRVPIKVNAAQGMYPIDVRVRATQAVLGQMLCLVDLPLGAPATGTAFVNNLPRTPSITPSITPTASDTPLPTATATDTPLPNETDIPSPTLAPSDTDEPTEIPERADEPTETPVVVRNVSSAFGQ